MCATRRSTPTPSRTTPSASPSVPFRVNDVGGIARRPDPAQQAVLLQQLSPAAPQQHVDDRCRPCRRRSSASATSARRFIRDENGQPGAGAHLRPVQRRRSRDRISTAAPRSRTPDHPEPESVRAADVQLLSAAQPHARRRLQHRTTSRRRSTQTDPPHSSNNRVDFSWPNHSIYGSGGISYAEIVTPRPFGESPFNDAAGVARRQEPVHPDRRRGRARPDAAARRPLRAQPRQHQEPERQQGRLHRLRLVRRPRQPAAVHPVPGHGAPNVNPNGYGGGNGGGSNWSAPHDRHTSRPSASSRPTTA